MLAALAVGGCESTPEVSGRDVVFIDTDEYLELRTDEKKSVLTVDPRSPADFAAGHIPGAVSIPLPDAYAEDPRLKTARTVVVYGDEWEDPKAVAMSKKLIAYKLKDVRTYRGGLEEWLAAGRELENGSASSEETATSSP